MIDNKTLWAIAFGLPAMESGSDIIAGGPLTRQPMTKPYRIVLRDLGEEGFVVHYQYFKTNPKLVPPHLVHDSFGDGDYFKANEIEQAALRFGRRVMLDAKHYASIYREAT